MGAKAMTDEDRQARFQTCQDADELAKLGGQLLEEAEAARDAADDADARWRAADSLAALCQQITQSQAMRDLLILQLSRGGMSLRDLATTTGLSPQRIHQICKARARQPMPASPASN